MNLKVTRTPIIIIWWSYSPEERIYILDGQKAYSYQTTTWTDQRRSYNNKSAVLNDLVVEWWFIWIIQFTRPRVITNLYAIHLRNLPIDHINILCGDTHHPSGHMCSPVHTTSHSGGLSGKLPLPYNIMDHSCSTDIGLYTSSRWHLSRVNWIPHCSLNIHPLDSHSVLFRRPFKCHFHANCVPQPARM